MLAVCDWNAGPDVNVAMLGEADIATDVVPVKVLPCGGGEVDLLSPDDDKSEV